MQPYPVRILSRPLQQCISYLRLWLPVKFSSWTGIQSLMPEWAVKYFRTPLFEPPSIYKLARRQRLKPKDRLESRCRMNGSRQKCLLRRLISLLQQLILRKNIMRLLKSSLIRDTPRNRRKRWLTWRKQQVTQPLKLKLFLSS